MVMSGGTDAPQQGNELVARKVGTLFGRSLGLGSETNQEALCTTDAHRCFLCALEKAAQDVLAGAVFIGWRYLVLYRGEARLEAEVSADPDDGTWRVVSVAESSFLAPELRELSGLESRPEVASGDFEICYLQVAAGLARAWWLRGPGADRSGDWLLPVQPSNPRLRGSEPALLSADAFRAAVARIALRKLDQTKILLQLRAFTPAVAGTAAAGETAAAAGETAAAGGTAAAGETAAGGAPAAAGPSTKG